ncbi:MAG: hypothetical protein CM1200mP28_09810 [Deltaproteobacteria bacterium]|nr:MAG: hypothetical protein CM1200mP28_09810 [Deltaproteobacteria bacterium]
MVELLSRENQQYKIEQVEDLVAQNEIISLYRNGPFWDLCEGPHVKSTSEIPKIVFHLILWQEPIGKVLKKTT